MKSPNLILILTDHFRPDAVGAYTPNLLRLASRGTTFSNCYCASPLCQPSRNSIVTGLYPAQHGVCGNQTPPIGDELRSRTFMSRLQGVGYHTAMIGKHHYIDRYGVGMDVTDDDESVAQYGFDYVLQVVDDAETQHNDDRYTKYLDEKGLLEEFRSGYFEGVRMYKHPFAPDDSADGFIGRNGIDFIRSYSDDAPFYLNLSFIGPHPPYWHPGELMIDPDEVDTPTGAEDSPDTRLRRAHYLEKCRLIDGYVGELADALEERGLLDDTCIIFTSDHGDNLGDYDIWDKRYFYEQCVGVPLIMTGPGIPSEERGNGPRISRALVSHVDLFPTILELAGIEHDCIENGQAGRIQHRHAGNEKAGIETGAAQRPGAEDKAGGSERGTDLFSRARRGKSILRMLKDERDAFHDAIFSELSTSVMIHGGAWKLVFDPEQGGVAYLFNLRNDPHELHNLAGVAGYENVTARLIERILEERIRRTQFTHIKEEQRLQRVRIG